MKIRHVFDFNLALSQGRHADVGGYPTYFICDDGEALSYAATLENARLIRDAIINDWTEGWRVIGYEINWEDDELFCCHTGEKIPSAYGEEP